MKTILNVCKKALTFVLVATIVACALPVGVYANEFQNYFEAENVQPADDATVIWTVKDDSLASNGKVVSGTKGASFVLTNVAESNQIIMMASGTESGVATVSIRENDQWREMGKMSFATTQDTAIKYGNEVKLSGIYIPQGAEIMVAPQVNMTIDYFRFAADPLNNEAELEPYQLLAKNGIFSGSVVSVDNIMSTVGSAVNLSAAGDSVTFTVPANIEASKYNSFNIKYYADADAVVSLSVDGTMMNDMTLFACSYGQFSSRGNNRATEINGGSTITITLKSGNVTLDMLTLFQLLIADEATEIKLPENSNDRSVTSLDGVWHATKSSEEKLSATIPVPEGDYYYTAAVPGFWDMVTPDMGDYTKQNLWYKKTIVMPDDYTADSGYTVQLEILKAQYGRSIYINGQFIEHYTWNYSASYTNITKYLKPGENTIEIMLGYYGSHFESIRPVAATDPERTEFRPGIPDSVSVVVNRTPQVYAVQTAADIDNGTVQVRTKLSNKTAQAVTTNVTITLYELGIVKNGVASKRVRVGKHVIPSVTVAANSIKQIDIDSIALTGFDKNTKAWCPDNPYLYEIEVKTSGDTLSERFGMRTFTFDPETKQPMLNGEIYRLLGTNVVINRFYEDPARGDLPWKEQWVRDLYATFRDTNWDVIRTHVGPFPDFWYDIADETGMMLVDEYALFTDWWFSYNSVMPEMRTIIDQRQTHPSIIFWDVQNEKAQQTITANVVKTLIDEDYDISNRNYENGMGLPYDENQPVEFHPYHFWGVTTMDEFVKFNTLSNTEPIGGGDNSGKIVNPKIINEYAEMWLDRWGDPTSISADNYAGFMPDATREERLQFYAEFIAKCTEFWRAGRNIAGIQYFSGLTYSKPNGEGATGDLLLPDISTPQVRPETQEIVKDSFERLGIAIERYDVYTAPGYDFTFPVTLINDLNRSVEKLPVTFRVTCNGRVLAEQEKIYDMAAVGDTNGGDLVTKNFEFVTPFNLSNGDELLVTATYNLNGKEVTSLRRIICRGFKDKNQEAAVDTLCSIDNNVEASSVSGGTTQSVVNGLLDTYTLGDKINVEACIKCGNANNGAKASVSVGAVKIELGCSAGVVDPACKVYVNGTEVGNLNLTLASNWSLGAGCDIKATINTSTKTVDISLLNLGDKASYSGSFEYTDNISFTNPVVTASVTGNYMNTDHCWKVTKLAVSNDGSERLLQMIPATNTELWTGNADKFDKDGILVAGQSGNVYTVSVNIDDYCGYWQSDANEDNYITVDLGTTTKINRVKLYWCENYGSEYKIQVSSDGKVYTDVVHVTDGTGGTVTHLLPNGTIARYVRMQGIRSSASNGYSLCEFEVYRKNNNAVIYNLGKSTSSSSYDAWWAKPSQAVDGALDTRWSASASQEDWITVDLGLKKEIFKVELLWTSYAYGKEYKIQISDDGVNFTDLIHVTNGKGTTATFEMPVGTYGRYVRMQGIQNNGSAYSMFEFNVYCEQVEGLLYSTGKQATTSHYDAWWAVPGKVTDGVADDESNRWAASASPNDWITIDLGVVKEITIAEFIWTPYAYAKEFKIQVSDDGEAFTDVMHVTGGGSGTARYELPANTFGRYVRMQGIAYGNLEGYSLYEFNVYITIPEELPSALENISLNKAEMTLKISDDYRTSYDQLRAYTQPLNANDIAEIKWSSNAPGIATVDSNGKVKAVSEGVANITYTVVTNDNETYTAQCAVTVEGAFLVTLEQGVGYDINATDDSSSPVTEGGEFSFTVSIAEDYEKGEDFAVYANGVELTEINGVYTISGISQNQTVTVSGVYAIQHQVVMGDINLDGVTNSADVLVLEQILLGIADIDHNLIRNVDFNQNSKIEPSDLSALKLLVLGLYSA